MNKNDFAKRQANRVLRQKLKLEKTFARELASYFAEQKRRKKTGKEISSIKPVLERHYKRIVKEFTGVKIKQDVQNKISESFEFIIAGKAQQRAEEIDKITEDRWKRSIQAARDQEPDATEETLLLIALQIFRNYNKNRVQTISISETQTVSESVRFEITKAVHLEMEQIILEQNRQRAKELYDLSGDYTSYQIYNEIDIKPEAILTGLLLTAKKKWMTMGDARVRDIHNAANGQEQYYLEPYQVGGELLMFPGDGSLGASAKNLVNCRCVSVGL